MDFVKFREDDKRKYWLAQFPSGSFKCIHCGKIADVLRHRNEQRLNRQPMNVCTCGALLAIDCVDAGGQAKHSRIAERGGSAAFRTFKDKARAR